MKRKLLLLGTARPGKSGGRGVGLHSRTVHQYSKSALVMPSSLSHEYPPLYVCTTPYSKMSKMISYHHDTTKKLDLDFLLNYKILLYFTFLFCFNIWNIYTPTFLGWLCYKSKMYYAWCILTFTFMVMACVEMVQ